MRLPNQSPPVQRSLHPCSSRPTADPQTPAEPFPNAVQGYGIAPSGAEECYGLQGAARDLCLGALSDY
jgi:hypothetical protein